MKHCGMTDIGLVRDQNQDSFFFKVNDNQEVLSVVCDGIGGGKAGDVASQLACEVLAKAFLKKKKFRSDKSNKEWISSVVKKANDTIYENSLTSRTKQGMGTTLAGVLIVENATYIFHLGDSRVYALYDDLICLTQDHNLALDLVKNGELSEEEALQHPRGKALTNALGIWSQYMVEINKIKSNYQSLLLCSDGLHGFVSETIINGIIKDESLSLSEKANALIESANNFGGFDNVTVVLIENGGTVHE